MPDLTARVLRARREVGDRVILDWLEVVRLAEPITFGSRGRGFYIARLRELWNTSQPQVSRRLAAINHAPPEVGLGRVEPARGAAGWWRVLPPGEVKP